MSYWVSEWQGHLLSCPGQLKSSKSRSPRRAGSILAQGRSLVNRASSLSSSRCQGLHCPGEPAAIWPNLRAWSTGPPHLPLQSASSPRWQSFEEVRFFRVSFHSFRQKRDSPSEWVNRPELVLIKEVYEISKTCPVKCQYREAPHIKSSNLAETEYLLLSLFY